LLRIRLIVPLLACAALAVPAVASASVTKVTSGSAQLALSSAASTQLSSAGITVMPTAPTTVSGSTYTFPIAGGRVAVAPKLSALLRLQGGFQLSSTSGNLTVAGLRAIGHGQTGWLFARTHALKHPCRVLGHSHVRAHCLIRKLLASKRIANITGLTRTGLTATGTAQLTRFSAWQLDRLAGKPIALAGEPIGTVTFTVAVS
jgi:hypothetical protein